jgi:2-polyprenyl-3-methyl-5-hydroxy-6-metoxy-1,4-benzoquinol methylase
MRTRKTSSLWYFRCGNTSTRMVCAAFYIGGITTVLCVAVCGVLCFSGLMYYAANSELSAAELDRDISSIRVALGTAYSEFIAKNFCIDDVRHYYQSTTDRDYWLLERFIGPGLHSRMTAPHPVGIQGGNTRQPALVLGEVRTANARRVLEVGCGRGHCSLFLAGAAPDVVFKGVDAVQRHVDVARCDAQLGSYTNVSFSPADMAELNFRDETKYYDVIFGCEALCHLDTEASVASFVQSAGKLLKSKGRLVIIDGFRSSTFGQCSKDYQTAMKLAESGFRIRAMPSKATWKLHCETEGFNLVKDINLTHEVLPFWTLGWRVARDVLLFPYLIQFLLRSSPARKETISNLLSVSMTAHAMKGGTAEYGLLVFEKTE